MSDLSLPQDYVPTLPVGSERELQIVKLAREIAMDLRPLKELLEIYQISKDQFELLKVNPHFTKVLTAEIEAWNSAVNTHQRVRLKSSAMMEEFLPELYRRMVSQKEDLLKVVKGAELVTKLAGMGHEEDRKFDPADKVVITINLGADHKLQFQNQLPPKVIEHDPANELQQGFEASLDVSNN